MYQGHAQERSASAIMNRWYVLRNGTTYYAERKKKKAAAGLNSTLPDYTSLSSDAKDLLRKKYDAPPMPMANGQVDPWFGPKRDLPVDPSLGPNAKRHQPPMVAWSSQQQAAGAVGAAGATAGTAAGTAATPGPPGSTGAGQDMGFGS